MSVASMILLALMICTIILSLVTLWITFRGSRVVIGRRDSSYSGVDVDESLESDYVLRPRLRVWVHQICTFLCLIFVITEIYASCGYSRTLECTDDISYLVVMATVNVVVLFCDSSKKISSQNWRSKSLWIPVYFMNAAFLVAYMLMGWSSITNKLRMAAAAALSLGGLFFSVAAAVDNKYMVLENPPTKEYTAELLSYITFSYINKDLIDLALSKESLELEDVPNLIDGDSCSSVHKVDYCILTPLLLHLIEN